MRTATCDVCTAYIADVQPVPGIAPDGTQKDDRIGDLRIVCDECEKTYEVIVRSKGVQPPDGTTEDRRVFLILFDDYDRRPMLVTGEAMARAAFKRWSDSWNAHLFVKIASNSRDDPRANDNATLVEPSMSTTSPPAGSLSSGSGASGEGVRAPDGDTEPVAASGSFMTRELATTFMRNYLKREPTEQHITACVDAYSALFGDTVSADWMEPAECRKAEALTRILNTATDEKRGWSHWDLVATICREAVCAEPLAEAPEQSDKEPPAPSIEGGAKP